MTTDMWQTLKNIEQGFRDANARDAARREAQKAEASRLVPRVIARYLTEAGKALGDASLAVTVTETGPRDDNGRSATTVSNCEVCPASNLERWETVTYGYNDKPTQHTVTRAAERAEQIARRWAEAHAIQCRELPVEG